MLFQICCLRHFDNNMFWFWGMTNSFMQQRKSENETQNGQENGTKQGFITSKQWFICLFCLLISSYLWAARSAVNEEGWSRDNNLWILSMRCQANKCRTWSMLCLLITGLFCPRRDHLFMKLNFLELSDMSSRRGWCGGHIKDGTLDVKKTVEQIKERKTKKASVASCWWGEFVNKYVIFHISQRTSSCNRRLLISTQSFWTVMINNALSLILTSLWRLLRSVGLIHF